MSYGYNSNITNSVGRPVNTPQPGISGALAGFNATAKTVLLFETNAGGADREDITAPSSTDTGGYAGPRGAAFGNGLEGLTGIDASGIYEIGNHQRQSYATGQMANQGAVHPSRLNNPRHFDGANFLMADGHVKWFKPEKVCGGLSAASPTDGISGSRAAGTSNATYAVTFSTM